MFNSLMYFNCEFFLIIVTLFSLYYFTVIQRKYSKEKELSLFLSVGHFSIFTFFIYFFLQINWYTINDQSILTFYSNFTQIEFFFFFKSFFNSNIDTNSLIILKIFLTFIMILCLISSVCYYKFNKNLKFEFFYILIFSYIG